MICRFYGIWVSPNVPDQPQFSLRKWDIVVRVFVNTDMILEYMEHV